MEREIKNQLLNITKIQNKMLEIQNKNNRFYRNQGILAISENLRQLQEIIMVKDLEELNDKEKFESVLQIATYYTDYLQNKIIELEESVNKSSS